MRRFLLVIMFITFGISVVYGFRVNRPPLLNHPLDQEQINKLNSFLQDIWNLQNGEFNLDIVTSTKTNAKNGDIWFIQTGNNVRIQYKAANHIYTVTADGW